MNDAQAQQLKERSKRLILDLVARQVEVSHELLRLIDEATAQNHPSQTARPTAKLIRIK